MREDLSDNRELTDHPSTDRRATHRVPTAGDLQMAAATGVSDSPRILLADAAFADDNVILNTLARSGLTYSLELTASGTESLAKFRSGLYDCVLLGDLSDCTTLEWLDEMGAYRFDEPRAVIVVSHAARVREAVESLKRGACDFLPKATLTPKSLHLAIRTAVREAEARRSELARQQKLQHLSLHDALTGLSNRQLFFDRLSQALLTAGRSGSRIVVLMLDLDRFKEVNDRLGHSAGDEVLGAIGSRLQGIVRRCDTVARLGGDEFGAILTTDATSEGASVVAERLCREITRPIAAGGQLVSVGLSVGIAFFPDHGEEPSELLQHADEAMYVAKRDSRGYSEYIGKHGRKSHGSGFLGSMLQDALERDELLVEYQPKVKLPEGLVTGVEALVRWRHPQRGLLYPADFVPAAERCDVIREVTYHILDHALEQCSSWLDAGLSLPVAVNLSPRMLDDEELPGRILEACSMRDLPASMLTLEITETALMANPARARRLVDSLHAAGVALSIDDFGTGYTSLKYLCDFQIAELKIDRFFAARLAHVGHATTIFQSVVELGSGLGLRVVAEGIEDAVTCSRVQALGCEHAQGFYFAPAMPAGDLRAWCSRWRASQWARPVPPTARAGPSCSDISDTWRNRRSEHSLAVWRPPADAQYC